MSITILLLVAHQGYQPIEYATPKKILETAGITVKTASNKAGTARASDETTTKVDVLMNDITDISEYQGLFIVGGPGALESLDNQQTYTLAKKFADAGKPFGAICISPRILAKAGVLKNKKATGWDEDGELGEIFEMHNAIYTHKPVVIDGNIITATGPRAAQEFGETIVRIVQK